MALCLPCSSRAASVATRPSTWPSASMTCHRPSPRFRAHDERTHEPVVGLDIGSSAVKAVELKPAGKGYRVAAFGMEPVPPDSHRRRRHHRRRRRRRRDPAGVRGQQGPSRPGGLRVALGQRRHRQEDHAAGDDRGRARRVDLLGGGAVHPVRHPGRQPRLPDPRPGTGPDSRGSDGGAARGRQEGEDRRLHRRDRPGRPHAGHRRRRRLRPAERLRGELRPRCRAPSSCCSTPAPAPSTSTSSGRPVGLHPRHLDGRQRLHRGGAEGARPAVRGAEQLKKGIPVDGATFEDARPCCAPSPRTCCSRCRRRSTSSRRPRPPTASTGSC
jgi:hypothetical protein